MSLDPKTVFWAQTHDSEIKNTICGPPDPPEKLAKIHMFSKNHEKIEKYCFRTPNHIVLPPRGGGTAMLKGGCP